MAGRGTDIKLGEGVSDLGGLMVLATERHESRRIDRQLRGRCARQGDPGESKFFISFEDDLMRNFGAAERMTKMMERFGLEDGQELEHPWLNRSVETAQKRVEQRNYQIRKRVLEFDDVMNKQREVVYGYRNDVIHHPEPREMIYETIEETLPDKVYSFIADGEPDGDIEPDYEGLLAWVNTTFPLRLELEESGYEGKGTEEVAPDIIQRIKDAYELKASLEDPEHLEHLERSILLSSVDRLWQEHLYAMDGLREGVHLRSYGQKDPLVEYKNEAYALFTDLMDTIKAETLLGLFRSATSREAFENFLANIQMGRDGAAAAQAAAATQDGQPPQQGGGGPSVSLSSGGMPAETPSGAKKPTIQLPSAPTQKVPVVGRNSPCPCGSGKKYKQCCGRLA